ncbi:MAG: ABC transporter ATP-binding protein [Lachnospiraceae bacterium]|nr:ABC transporter ATP-binding protein [Lachnospiraceae bacterium]MBR0107416.1 ABC transporter ATP-binding protein [Lachnospiraceae bacterium]
MLKTLLGNLGKYKRSAILSPIMTLCEVVIDVLLPIVISFLIDRGVSVGNMHNVLVYGGLMLIMAFVALFFGVMGARLAADASTGLAANLRRHMYEKIQTFAFANIDRFSTAGLVTRLTTDVTNVQNAFMMVIRIMSRAPLMLVGSLIACFLLNAKLSLIFVVAIIILFTMIMLIIRKALPIFRTVFDRYDDLNTSVQENVTAIRVVKSFVREEYENQRFEYAAAYLRNLSIKAEKIVIMNMPVMMIAIHFCMIALSWFGARLIVADQFTTGQLTSMFSYVMQILMNLMMMSMIFVMVSMSMASANRIAQVLDEEPDITDPEDPLFEVPDGSIDFENVNFAYTSKNEDFSKTEGEYVLRDIDLHIRSGEVIGVIGGTGSGKSSFVNLISRLYDVNEGAVKVGGHDVREYDLEALRNSVSVVLQKNVLFSGTILDNLRWGKEDATEEECREACEIACADEFIQNFPDKYETWIEQGGANVSGGQRQRLCIARALMKSPKILILDDSTSAVDTATDAKLRAALTERVPGMTTLIIAQRVASVMNADRIIVMDDGRVDAFDTHEALLETNEIYRDIYQTQTNGADFDEPG